jgi:hypothetical protein
MAGLVALANAQGNTSTRLTRTKNNMLKIR